MIAGRAGREYPRIPGHRHASKLCMCCAQRPCMLDGLPVQQLRVGLAGTSLCARLSSAAGASISPGPTAEVFFAVISSSPSLNAPHQNRMPPARHGAPRVEASSSQYRRARGFRLLAGQVMPNGGGFGISGPLIRRVDSNMTDWLACRLAGSMRALARAARSVIVVFPI